ncbi:MAG TPA: adenylate/guanylate cyclase domain-containing protein [Candidatus Dormibacteraeota bacterium]|nr:adenylate/guanylate cyclase domain-containing protein [Candidatus Dormibacteraeota bacterium]
MAVSTEERRIVTVLFADMAGSTALGEALDPEDMRRLLQRYYAIARDCVERHGGTVEKFIGDAVMAVFGLPTAHGDDADRAVAAAVAIREAIQRDPMLNERIALRFGVSTGEVVASREQSGGDFLITGDATNVAARLQQAAEPWAILASDRTVRAANNFDFGDPIEIVARGKSAPVAARIVLGPRKLRSRLRVQLPLIGRETDLAQLELVARRAVSDKRPSMVSVIAPAGVGKTRLVEEFLSWLPTLTPNATVATAQCLPYGQQLTYWPMRQVLLTLTGKTEDTPPGEVREAIAGWLHRIGVQDPDRDARLLAATIGEAGTEGADRDLLFAAWRSALEATARQHPVVIVFEDLHWSSDSLLDLAEFVMQPRGEAALLMIVLARPELLDRRPTWGGGRLNHLAIALEPLGPAAIADLVRHLLDSDAPDVVELVSDRSEGNPFYAGELVRTYLDHGSLERLPDTVQGTVLARLDLLPPSERRVLQLGSVFGRAFRAAGVAALGPDLAARVHELCENLTDRDLIRPHEAGSYAFRHILIQEVAYGTLPRAERARLHAEAASWVESMTAGREIALAEILAFHYREAAVLYSAVEPGTERTDEIRRQAAKWLRKASEVAAAAAATPEAVRHIRGSFDFVDPKVTARLHERIGELTAGDSGIEEYRIALSQYEQQGAPVDDQLRALAGMLMIAMRWVGSVGARPSDEWVERYRSRGRMLLDSASDPYTIARFLVADSFFPFWSAQMRMPSESQLEAARTSAERAMEIAEQLGDDEVKSMALDSLAGIFSIAARWQDALRTTEARVALEPRLSLYERLDTHSMITNYAYAIGDLAKAKRDSGEMASRLLPGQAPYPALNLYAWRTLTLYVLGEWEEAVATFWRAMDAWRDAGLHSAGYALRGFLAGLALGRARNDPRLVSAATATIEAILAGLQGADVTTGLGHRVLQAYLRGEGGFSADDPSLVGHYPPDMTELRLALACDRREQFPPELLDLGLRRAVAGNVTLLEAQVRRARGLSNHDPHELALAIATWERAGALTWLGRGRAERGVLTHDPAETEAGLAILRKIGDAAYVDRFTTR